MPIQQVDALGFGQVVHEGLARILSGKPVDLREAATKVRPDDAHRVAAMLSHFPDHWRQYEVVAVEMPFEVAVRNPATGRSMRQVVLRGYIDAVIRKDDQTYILEHKTTSEEILGFGVYWSRLSLDDQLAIYASVMRADGVIYNVLRKVAIRPAAVDRKTAGGESASEQDVLRAYGRRCEEVILAEPEAYYQWRVVHQTWAERFDVMVGVYDRVQTVMAAHRHGRWPRHPHACRTIYGTCQYLDVCTGRARLDDDALFMEREERR